MIRVRIGICILAVIVLACIGSTWGIQAKGASLLQKLSAVEVALAPEDAPDYAAAAEAEAALRAEWNASLPWLRVLISQNHLREVSVIIDRLAPMLAAQSDDLEAELAVLRGQLIELRQAELPRIQQVF